jgi:hypothetical protein
VLIQRLIAIEGRTKSEIIMFAHHRSDRCCHNLTQTMKRISPQVPRQINYNFGHVYIHTNARTCVGAVKHPVSSAFLRDSLLSTRCSCSCSMVDAVLQHIMPSRLLSIVASQTPDPAFTISVPQSALPSPAGAHAFELCGQRAVWQVGTSQSLPQHNASPPH